MLPEWRLVCPRLNGDMYRVFSGPGVPQQWPLPRLGGGGPLLYSNFRRRYWVPGLKAAGVHYVAHHSFVSVLQAQGVEVGLVAKLAGHSNPAVTLGHCTQAVRGGAEAVAMLDRAYQGGVIKPIGSGEFRDSQIPPHDQRLVGIPQWTPTSSFCQYSSQFTQF